jgi:ATPase subunit of ABC transporter with duplicated ATPase domains
VSNAVVDLRGVGFSYGARTVLTDVTLTAGPASRLAVVGPNGTGKSTLLAIVAGALEPEVGSARLSPPTATVALLPQERDRRPGETLRAYLARRTGVAAADAALRQASDALAAGTIGSEGRYADALERWLALGGADFDGRAPAVLDGLGIAETLLDQ